MTFEPLSLPPLGGYFFDPPEYEHAPGAPRLEVYLADISLPDQIIPRTLRLAVRIENDIEELTIDHPWTQGREFTAGPGCISLHGPLQTQAGAYTFGGCLRIYTQEEYTTCTLTSPAPILNLDRMNPQASMLFEEVEALLAQQRAAHLDETPSYTCRLAHIDPARLYACCLHSLLQKFNDPALLRNIQSEHFRTFLRAEIKALQEADRWPERAMLLEELK